MTDTDVSLCAFGASVRAIIVIS